MAEHGLAESVPPDDVFEDVRREYELDSAGDDVREVGLHLRSAGIACLVWSEVDEVPVRHDEIALGLAQITRGRFVPRPILQRWKDEKRRDAGYEVEFLHDERLLRFHAEYRGDWTDGESVVHAFNTALEAAGKKERFLRFGDPDELVAYVFGDPEMISRIAARFFLSTVHIGEDAARRAKETENRMLQHLREKANR